MKPKKLKPLKAVGPVHAKPLHHGAAQAEGTGASNDRLRARGLFYADVAAALCWSEMRVRQVLASMACWGPFDLDAGERIYDPRSIVSYDFRRRPSEYSRTPATADMLKLWSYLKAIPETHPSLMIAYYSKPEGGKHPGTVHCVYYQDKEGKTRYDVDAALAVLNDRYEVIEA